MERLIALPVKQDRKLVELKQLIKQVFSESEKGETEKILIFTEYRKTQDHLVEELEKIVREGLGGRYQRRHEAGPAENQRPSVPR